MTIDNDTLVGTGTVSTPAPSLPRQVITPDAFMREWEQNFLNSLMKKPSTFAAFFNLDEKTVDAGAFNQMVAALIEGNHSPKDLLSLLEAYFNQISNETQRKNALDRLEHLLAVTAPKNAASAGDNVLKVESGLCYLQIPGLLGEGGSGQVYEGLAYKGGLISFFKIPSFAATAESQSQAWEKIVIKKMDVVIDSDESEKDFVTNNQFEAMLAEKMGLHPTLLLEDAKGPPYPRILAATLILDNAGVRNLSKVSELGLTDETIKSFSKKVITAVIDMHTKGGICSLDLKPANIMLAADGSVNVVDFGLGIDTTFVDFNDQAQQASNGKSLKLLGYHYVFDDAYNDELTLKDGKTREEMRAALQKVGFNGQWENVVDNYLDGEGQDALEKYMRARQEALQTKTFVEGGTFHGVHSHLKKVDGSRFQGMSLRYAPPELIAALEAGRPAELSSKMDIFSLGRTLSELEFKRDFFLNNNPAAIPEVFTADTSEDVIQLTSSDGNTDELTKLEIRRQYYLDNGKGDEAARIDLIIKMVQPDPQKRISSVELAKAVGYTNSTMEQLNADLKKLPNYQLSHAREWIKNPQGNKGLLVLTGEAQKSLVTVCDVWEKFLDFSLMMDEKTATTGVEKINAAFVNIFKLQVNNKLTHKQFLPLIAIITNECKSMLEALKKSDPTLALVYARTFSDLEDLNAEFQKLATSQYTKSASGEDQKTHFTWKFNQFSQKLNDLTQGKTQPRKQSVRFLNEEAAQKILGELPSEASTTGSLGEICSKEWDLNELRILQQAIKDTHSTSFKSKDGRQVRVYDKPIEFNRTTVILRGLDSIAGAKFILDQILAQEKGTERTLGIESELAKIYAHYIAHASQSDTDPAVFSQWLKQELHALIKLADPALTSDQVKAYLKLGRDFATLHDDPLEVTVTKSADDTYRIGQYDSYIMSTEDARKLRDEPWYMDLVKKYPHMKQMSLETIAQIFSKPLLTTMRNMKGPANTAHNYVFIKKEAEFVPVLSTTRSSTPSAFNMKDPDERALVATENASMVLGLQYDKNSGIHSDILEQVMSDIMRKHNLEDNDEGKIIEVPLLYQSLLTGSLADLFKDDEKSMLKDKHQAIKAIQAMLDKGEFKKGNITFKFTLIDTNHPVNTRQNFYTIPTGYDYKDINKLIKIAVNFPNQSDLLSKAITQLQEIHHAVQKPFAVFGQRRQAQMYMAAFEQIITSEMGGIPISGCKSAADRSTEVATLAQAITLIFHKTGELLSYNDILKETPLFKLVITKQVELLKAAHEQHQFERLGMAGARNIGELESAAKEVTKKDPEAKGEKAYAGMRKDGFMSVPSKSMTETLAGKAKKINQKTTAVSHFMGFSGSGFTGERIPSGGGATYRDRADSRKDIEMRATDNLDKTLAINPRRSNHA